MSGIVYTGQLWESAIETFEQATQELISSPLMPTQQH